MVRGINEGSFFEFEQSGMEWGEQPWVGYRSKLYLLIEGSPKQSGSQAQASLDLKPRRGPPLMYDRGRRDVGDRGLLWQTSSTAKGVVDASAENWTSRG